MTGSEPCFAIDNNQFLTNDTCYIIIGNDLEYLQKELISDAVWYSLRHFYMGGGIENEFKVNNLLNLPIKRQIETYHLTLTEIQYIISNL
jgi:hypothetical protein